MINLFRHRPWGRKSSELWDVRLTFEIFPLFDDQNCHAWLNATKNKIQGRIKTPIHPTHMYRLKAPGVGDSPYTSVYTFGHNQISPNLMTRNWPTLCFLSISGPFPVLEVTNTRQLRLLQLRESLPGYRRVFNAKTCKILVYLWWRYIPCSDRSAAETFLISGHTHKTVLPSVEIVYALHQKSYTIANKILNFQYIFLIWRISCLSWERN